MQSLDFLMKHDPAEQLRTIRPVTPYPGSPLYDYAIEQGLLAGPGDFYERVHTNSDLMSVNFTLLTDDEFDEALLQANRALVARYFDMQAGRYEHVLEKLYRGHDASFRGFRQT